MQRSRLLLFIAVFVALTLLAMVAGPTLVKAGPEKPPISFGLLMKPGWGGAGDSIGANFGNIYILKCSYLKGKSPRLSTSAPVQATQVITGWGKNATCARWLLPYLEGIPAPDGYQLPR